MSKEMMNVMDVIDAIDPELYKIANLLDLLTDLTFDLPSDGTGRSPNDRVHTLAMACLSLTNSLMAETEKLTEEARNTHKPAPEISDDEVRTAYRAASPLAKVLVMNVLRDGVEAEERAKQATTRAETAEQELRSTTQRLDSADREIAFLRSVVEFKDGQIANLEAEKAA
jgi:hypothetical protein